MRKLFTILALAILVWNTQAQHITNCKEECEMTRIVEEGPFLGVQIMNGPGNTSAKIIKVFTGTAAEKTGFVVGDIITKVDETIVKNNYHLVDIVGAHKPGDKVVITYVHNGVTATVKVRIGAKSTRFVTEKVCCDTKPTAATVDGALMLYPNPANTKVTISTKENVSGDVSIVVYNMDGKEVLNDNIQNEGTINKTIDVSTLGAGEYIVRIGNGTVNYTQKLFVVK